MLAAIIAGILILLIPVAFIVYVNIGGIRKAIRDRRVMVTEMACSIDADCPEGFECQNGHCVPVV